ncbi:MAG: glycosyltransferase family 9 protein [Gammaproteobacteria bacterium]|nr:glycosyltransferase family 9 protein [Gammaproteobacteria bacterium]
MINIDSKRILICKTNQIGDVTFALPIASALKLIDPSCKIIFMGRGYTRELIELYHDVDEFADCEENLDDLNIDICIHVSQDKSLARRAKEAKIPIRVGNGRRFFYWRYCNKLVMVKRKNSELHETQLDMQFLKPFVKNFKNYSLQEIINLRHYKKSTHANRFIEMLDKHKFNLILHPLTRGRHIEWSLDHFAALIKSLQDRPVKIFVTGSEAEAKLIGDKLNFPEVINLAGKTSLSELINFIAKADGLIAASTGPVHLAANFGIKTLGLYAPIKPFHAGRWGPVGSNAISLSVAKDCNACRFTRCQCVNKITVEQVSDVINRWLLTNPGHSQNPDTAATDVTS